MTALLIHLLIIIICMIGSAFFSGIETGVISIHRVRLKHAVRRGSRNAVILQWFTNNSDRLLGPTLVGNNICIVVISILSASMAATIWKTWGETISTPLVAIIVLIFCEYLPKAWFHGRPLEHCSRYARVLRFTELILRPVSWTIVGFTKWLVPGPEKSLGQHRTFVTREDLTLLAREGEKSGALSPGERAMINRVFELPAKKAKDVMRLRKDVVTAPTNATIPEFLELARTSLYTRMPLYDKNQDKFIGIINVFYVLANQPETTPENIAHFARPPLFIPEDTSVDDIFPLLRRSRQPMCLVTNEKSEVTGMITTEDILEEIVGAL